MKALSFSVLVGLLVLVARPVGAAPPGEPHSDRVATLAKASTETKVNVTAVRVLIRLRTAENRPVEDLRVEEIEVLEDGMPARVLAVERITAEERAQAPSGSPGEPLQPPQAAPPRVCVVVYLLPKLAHRGDMPRVVSAIRNQAEKLVAMGPVSVVVADPEPKIVAASITGEAALVRVLAHANPSTSIWSQPEDIRRHFLTDMQGPNNFRARLTRARLAAIDESSLLKGALGRIVSWARANAAGPGYLLLGMDGFDLDLADFYLRVLQPKTPDEMADFQRAQQEFLSFRLETSLANVAAALAERGWSVVTFDSGQSILSFAGGAENAGREVFRELVGDRSGLIAKSPSQQQTTFPVAQSTYYRPREPLETLAEMTGGRVVNPDRPLDADFEDLGHAWVLSYQVDRPADGKAHSVEITSRRAGMTIAAPKLVFAGTPEGESEMRGRRLLAGTTHGQELPVRLIVVPGASAQKNAYAGTLEVRVGLTRVRPVLESLGKTVLRVTVVVEIKDHEPFVRHETHECSVGAGDEWIYDAPLEWSENVRKVAVVVEELTSGAWGGAVSDLPRRPAPSHPAGFGMDRRPPDGSVHE